MTALDCPVCHAPFREIFRDNVLIDICTQCQGIWLDHGELDRILAYRSALPASAVHRPNQPQPLKGTS